MCLILVLDDLTRMRESHHQLTISLSLSLMVSYSHSTFHSFAIVMWELMTRRDVFPGMLGFQIAIEVGTKGLRPELPTEEECPITEMNSLMQRAWSEDPHDRPSFNEIVNEMESILEVRFGLLILFVDVVDVVLKERETETEKDVTINTRMTGWHHD